MVAVGRKLYVVGGSRYDEDDGFGGSDDMFDTMEVLEPDPDADEIPVRPFVGSGKRTAPDAHLPARATGRMTSGIEFVDPFTPFAHVRGLSSPSTSFASSAPAVETPTSVESKGRWTTLSMPYRREGIAVAAFDSKLIIAGGANHNERYFSVPAGHVHPGKRVHCFDPQQGTWHDLPCMNHVRVNASLIEWDGKLLAIAGEEARREPSFHPSHPSFVDQRSCVDECETKSKCETQRNQFRAKHQKRLAALRKVERYDPVDGTWHEAAPLRAARTQPLVFRAKNMI